MKDISKAKKLEKMIVHILSDGEEHILSEIKQIIDVRYGMRYKIDYSITLFTTILNNLTNKGILLRVGYGTYKLKDNLYLSDIDRVLAALSNKQAEASNYHDTDSFVYVCYNFLYGIGSIYEDLLQKLRKMKLDSLNENDFEEIETLVKLKASLTKYILESYALLKNSQQITDY